MATEAFARAWDELSEIQKYAASWEDDAPLLVLAGPGSGKTRVLTCAITQLLDKSPEEHFRVLALTFTNKAAEEMRRRVEEFLPNQERRLFIGTIHSFCADILRQHGSHIGINPNFQIFSQDSDLQAVLGDAVNKSMETSDIISDQDKKVLPIIKRLKSLLILPDDCCADAAIEDNMKNRMAVIYPEYEAQLQTQNALDFESLLLRVYELFRKYPALAKRYRTVFEYIFIDEFQDTNYAQYQIIRALAGGDNINLFFVADDDQIIYQWNGASHKRIDEFRNEYMPRVIQLPMNYRCPPEIVEIANKLIQHNFLRTSDKQPFEAFRSSSGDDDLRLLSGFPTFEDEITAIANDIKERFNDKLSNVAILARNRRLLEKARELLVSNDVSAVIAQRKDQFQSTPFLWLYSSLCLANDRQNPLCLQAVSGTFYQLTDVQTDIDEVIALAKAGNGDYFHFWTQQILRQTDTQSEDDRVYRIVDNTVRNLVERRDYKTFCTQAIEQFESWLAVADSDDPSKEKYSNYQEELKVWKNLYREINSAFGQNLTLESFLQELQMRSKESPPDDETVVLMTIHNAKGKEFDHVYLIGLIEDEIPSYQSKQKGDASPEMEEERRNCFVAITRATRTLCLSFSESFLGWNRYPSRFLVEMGLLEDS